MQKNNYKCPKCGGELSDHWDGEAVSAFVGEWSDDRFRCEGKLVEAKDDRWGIMCGLTARNPVGILGWRIFLGGNMRNSEGWEV